MYFATCLLRNLEIAACSCFCEWRTILWGKSQHKCVGAPSNRSIRVQLVATMGHFGDFWPWSQHHWSWLAGKSTFSSFTFFFFFLQLDFLLTVLHEQTQWQVWKIIDFIWVLKTYSFGGFKAPAHEKKFQCRVVTRGTRPAHSSCPLNFSMTRIWREKVFEWEERECSTPSRPKVYLTVWMCLAGATWNIHF